MQNVVDEDAALIRIQVAERLGWRSIEYSKDGYLIGFPAGQRVLAVIPSYAKKIEAAWTLVDYLGLFGVGTLLRYDFAGQVGKFCLVKLVYQGRVLAQAQARTATLAICQAFLSIRGNQLACSFTTKGKPAALGNISCEVR